MSKFTDAYWRRVQRQATQYTPRVRNSIIRAVDSLKGQLTDSAVQRLVASGDLNVLTLKIFDAASMDSSFKSVDVAVQSVVKSGLDTIARTSLPNGGKVNGVPAVHFNVLDDHVVQAIQTLDTRTMQPFKTDIVEAARAVFAKGMEDGLGPKAIAKGLRDIIGVSPTQANAVANFRGLLESGDRGALSRGLRDRRFDSTLNAALGKGGEGLSETQIDKMVAAYAQRMVAFNAETNARTMTLDALKQGQTLAWQSAIDQGIVDGDRLMKTWVGVKDDRERQEHLDMEGETVPFDEPYSNGEMEPGESTYNCRCVSYVFEESARSGRDVGSEITADLGIE